MKTQGCSLLLVAALAAASVQAETTDCTPLTALPAIISTQGVYCLHTHLSTNLSSGNAITISVNNVTLDLNGWKLGGLAAGTTTGAYGIYSEAKNVTVRNGIVRGFRYGINLTGQGAVVQDIRADQNTNGGIWVGGPGALVERNQVVDTGGSTIGPVVSAIALRIGGAGSKARGNLVSGITSLASNEFGIYVAGDGAVIENNFVTDDGPPAAGGVARGVFITSADTMVVGNTFATFDECISYFQGSGLYNKNTAMGCTTAFVGGTNGGANASN